jgi:hypothetical protein
VIASSGGTLDRGAGCKRVMQGQGTRSSFTAGASDHRRAKQKETSMAYENLTGGDLGSGTRTQREGTVARSIERQTSKLPSDLFLWGGVGAIALSLGLQLSGKKNAGNFVANWVPTVLILGLYNKVVKIGGHDRETQQLD